MSLEQIASHGPFASDFSTPPTGATGALPRRGNDDPAILWLTMDRLVSRAFSGMTRSMREAALVGEAGLLPPDHDPSAWLERGAVVLERADPVLVHSLRRAASRACPVIVVRGLPVDPVPPATPDDGIVDLEASRQAIINLHAVVGCLGLHPVAYVKESSSTLHAVCPMKGARGEVSSRGFDAALPLHTDYADRPIDEPVRDQSPAAAVLAFAVERAEPAIPMQCVPTRRLLSVLSPEQIRIGRLDEFAVRAPDLFGGGQPRRVRRLFLSDIESGERCRLNFGTMIGLTARASRLLHEIREVLSDETMIEMIHVRRGDVVIMDNQRTLHRRASFAPRWDGTDRYFIRMSAVRDCHAGLSSDPRRPWIWS